MLEGSHRNTKGEYKQFVGIARGSTGELKYHLMLAKDLNYLKENEYIKFDKLLNDISKMLRGLINSLS